MKRLIFSSLLLASCITVSAASTLNSTSNTVSVEQQEPKIKSYIINKEGKLYVGKGDTQKPLERELSLMDGTKIQLDGTVVYPNGKTTKLSNGQLINLNDGKIHTSQK